MQDNTPPIKKPDATGTAHAYVFCDTQIAEAVATWRSNNPHLELLEVSTASFYRGRESPFDVHMVGMVFRAPDV